MNSYSAPEYRVTFSLRQLRISILRKCKIDSEIQIDVLKPPKLDKIINNKKHRTKVLFTFIKNGFAAEIEVNLDNMNMTTFTYTNHISTFSILREVNTNEQELIFFMGNF